MRDDSSVTGVTENRTRILIDYFNRDSNLILYI